MNYKFLETITFFGNDMLIPINDIKSICMTSSFKIFIKCFSDTEAEECFNDEESMIIRYKEIKKIIGA